MDDKKPRLDDKEIARTVETRTEAFARDWTQRPGVRAKIDAADRFVKPSGNTIPPAA
jgi:hypothetical protein